MVDTSRTQLWAMRAGAIAVALALAACSSSGGGGSDGGSGGGGSSTPPNPNRLVATAEGQAKESLSLAQAATATARNLAFVNTGGDSSVAMRNAQAVLDAGDDVDRAITDLEALLENLEAAEPSGSAAAVHDAVTENVRETLAMAQEVQTEFDAFRAPVTGTDPDNPRDAEAFASGLGEQILTMLEAGSHLTETHVGAFTVPVGAFLEVHNSEGLTAAQIVGDNVESRRVGGDTVLTVSLDGLPASSLNNPRFVTSDDERRPRLNADGTGWISEGVPADEVTGTATQFAVGRSVPGVTYFNGVAIGDAVYCLATGCRVENGVLRGEWYGVYKPTFDGPGDEHDRDYRTVYTKISGQDFYEIDPDPHILYGYWLDNTEGAEQLRLFANKRKTSPLDWGYNLDAADLTNDRADDPMTLLDNESSATYSGPARGMSVRSVGTGDDTVYHSGRFTADARLTVTFSDTSPVLAGTIDGFRADPGSNPAAVGSDWAVRLVPVVLVQGEGDDELRGRSDIGTTVAIGSSTRSGEWSAEAYGNDLQAPVHPDPPYPPVQRRPDGFFGGFKAYFEGESMALGIYDTRKD